MPYSVTRQVGCIVTFESFLNNEACLKALVRALTQDTFELPESISIQRTFWSPLQSMTKILLPVKTVMNLLESDHATMADELDGGWMLHFHDGRSAKVVKDKNGVIQGNDGS